VSILVIGRQGQLAQSLSAAASASGRHVTIVGRPEADLATPESIVEAIAAARPSVVINAAAYTAVDRAESESNLAFAINADAVGHIGRVCTDIGAATLHVSTDYVFDGSKSAPYLETDPVAPLGAYGASKAAGEDQLRAANPRHVILRTAWVYSPYGSNFLKTMLRLASERPVLSVVNDQRGNPTYAPFLASLILQIADTIEGNPAGDSWGTYHASGSGEATWYEFAREIFERGRQHGFPSPEVKPITTAEYPTPAARPANSRMNCAKLREKFGVSLPHWRTGVADCIEAIAPVGATYCDQSRERTPR